MAVTISLSNCHKKRKTWGSLLNIYGKSTKKSYYKKISATKIKITGKKLLSMNKSIKNKERREYDNNLDLNRVTNNKRFWKTVKTLLSNKGNILKKSL